jgi:hypothetical protein
MNKAKEIISNYLPGVAQFTLTVLLPDFWIIFLVIRISIDQNCERLVESLMITLIGFITGTIIRSLFDFELFRLPNEFFTDDITYTLGIPSIPEDIKHFHNLIDNINKQTKLPNDIIIALSGTTDLVSKQIEIDLNNISKVPVKITNTTDKNYAGINRNRVAETSTNDYIVFLDADDFMHPQRIEIVDKVLKKNNKPVGLIHGLTSETDNSSTKFDNWEVWNGKKL